MISVLSPEMGVLEGALTLPVCVVGKEVGQF